MTEPEEPFVLDEEFRPYFEEFRPHLFAPRPVKQGAGAYSIGSATWPGLSKLIEEAGEVMQVAGKIIGAGGDTDHWDGTDLRPRLENELADLLAAIKFVMDKNALNQRIMRKRSEAKQAVFDEWHSQSGRADG